LPNTSMTPYTISGKTYYRDPVSNYLFKTNLAVGDSVERITAASRRTSSIQKGDTTTLTSVSNSVSRYDHVDTVYDRAASNSVYIYEQKVRVDGSAQQYNGSNFDYAKGNNMLLEVNRPTMIREFKEVVKDGKTVREWIGDFVEVDSLSAARTYTSNEISNSIRSKNEYRKFAIFTENSVAQAKQPEVEFK
jgi:hypothetical protein